MRVVLDTNVLVSALLSAGHSPALLLDAWRDNRFELLTSPFMEHMDTAARLDKLKEFTEKLWSEAISGNKSPTNLSTVARSLQDEILEGRKRSPLVFDTIFKWLRRDYEEQMNHAASELVAEAKRKLESK